MVEVQPFLICLKILIVNPTATRHRFGCYQSPDGLLDEVNLGLGGAKVTRYVLPNQPPLSLQWTRWSNFGS
jgi:hypothetical protein